MKATGIVRKVEDLGRLVIPVELRRTLGIEIGDGLEIFTDGDSIVLKKYEPTCIFCGEANDVMDYRGKKICQKCLTLLRK